MNKLDQKGFSALVVLLMLIVIGTVGATGWYVLRETRPSGDQQTQNQATEQTTIDEEVPNQENSLVIQNFRAACQSGSGLRACGEVKYKKDLSISEVWVEFGKSADSLSQSALRFSDSQARDEGEHAVLGFIIEYEELEYDTKYFYKVKATVDDRTIESDVQSFKTVAK